jgi:hypothetical protein
LNILGQFRDVFNGVIGNIQGNNRCRDFVRHKVQFIETKIQDLEIFGQKIVVGTPLVKCID